MSKLPKRSIDTEVSIKIRKQRKGKTHEDRLESENHKRPEEKEKIKAKGCPQMIQDIKSSTPGSKRV